MNDLAERKYLPQTLHFARMSAVLMALFLGGNASAQTFFKDCITGTVKCNNCVPGDVGSAHGKTYTAVDNAMLANLATNHAFFDLDEVCTTLVTDMSSLFYGETTFNQDISEWDVSSVTDMSQMFAYCDAFTQDIGNWETHNAENMQAMFFSADNFHGDYLQYWDVSSVTNMHNMFNGAANFGEDISSWDVSSVQDMQQMFFNAASFQADLTQWCVVNIAVEPSSFATGSSLWENFHPDWGFCPSCTDPTADNYQPLATSENGSCYYFFLDADGLTIKCTNCVPSDKGEVDGTQYVAVGNDIFETLRFDLNTACTSFLNQICTTPVTNMQDVFHNTTVPWTIRSWDVSNVTNMFRMLSSSSCIPDITHWDVSSVTNMQDMFNSTFCFNQEIGSWDVSNVTNMYGMFSNSAINNDITGWDVSSVTDMRDMFKDTQNFNRDIGGWDVSSVQNMYGMFTDAQDFDQDLSAWCVSEVEDLPVFEWSPLWGFSIGSPLIEAHAPIWGTCPLGCTDPAACNYDPNSTIDDGSCIFGDGCTDPTACNYDAAASCEDGSCIQPGCMDFIACNYDANATCDGGITCTYLETPAIDLTNPENGWTFLYYEGCGVSPSGGGDIFFDPDGTWGNDGWGTLGNWSMCGNEYKHDYYSGDSVYQGTWDGTTITGTFDDGALWNGCFTMELSTAGCTDPAASNYDAGATVDNGSCYYFFLDANGVTIKCVGCEAGDEGMVGATNYIAVDNTTLPVHVAEGIISTTYMCTSLVTSTANLFQNETGAFGNLAHWDMSGVTNTVDMFQGATNFNEDLNFWDMSNLESAAGMFSGASNFNGNISSWNTPNLENTSFMFYQAESFQGNLSDWNMSSAQYTQYMFEGALLFNSPLNNWDVSGVTNMQSMFAVTNTFDQPLDNWDVSSVNTMTYMFYLALAFDQDISGWCVTQIPVQPDLFALNAPLSPSEYPVWGTCPNPCVNCFDVTFRLDLSMAPAGIVNPEVNSSFNEWCGNCNPLTDPDGDDIWETTIQVPAGSHLWKFSADNWANQEMPTDPASAPCFIFDEFGFVNRSLDVSADMVLPAYCWESCGLCANSAENTTEDIWICPGSAYTFPDGTTVTDIQSAVTHVSINPDASLTTTNLFLETLLTISTLYNCDNDELEVTITDLGTFNGAPSPAWDFQANGQIYNVTAPGTTYVPGVSPDQTWRLSMFETNNCAPDYLVYPDCFEAPCTDQAIERVPNGNFDNLAVQEWTEIATFLDGTDTGYGVLSDVYTYDASASAAWFGGFDQGSFNSLDQDIFLPETTETTLLTWRQWESGGCAADDVFTVYIDDVAIHTQTAADNPNCGVWAWYLYTVDISAYTTGETYNLKLEYIQNGTNGYTNLLVDNVSIQTCPCPEDITEVTVQVCQWDSYTFPDGTTVDNINEGFVQYSYSSPPPCVVGIATTIEVLPVNVSFSQPNVCHGDTYTYADGISQVITSQPSGTYQSFVTGVNGCDSVVYEAVVYIPEIFVSEDVDLCEGDSYTFPDGTLTENIISDFNYASTLTSALGCDSVITSMVTVTPASCNDPLADNYDPGALCFLAGACTYSGELGCTDVVACNFDPDATLDDGTCSYLNSPVVDMTTVQWELFFDTDCDGGDGSIFMDYDPDNTWNSVSTAGGNWSLCGNEYTNGFTGYDGYYGATWNGIGFVGEVFFLEGDDLVQCVGIYPVGPGCTNPQASNYNPAATSDDGSCTLTPGCTDTAACNYDPSASTDDGSCAIIPGDLDNDCVVGTSDLLIVIGDFGCTEPNCPIAEGELPQCVGNLNGDCNVSAVDILFVLGLFGTGI